VIEQYYSEYVSKAWHTVPVALLLLLIVLPCCRPSTKDLKKDLVSKSVKKVSPNETLSQEIKARVESDSIVATYILVRHAEKVADVSDPHLSEKGQTRAKELADLLDNIPLDAVFSTIYNRTQETAQPVAFKQSLEVKSYDPSDLVFFTERLKTDYYSHNVLVVGHSNTTPQVMNAILDVNVMSDIPEDEYQHLLICFRHKNGSYEMIKRDYTLVD